MRMVFVLPYTSLPTSRLHLAHKRHPTMPKEPNPASKDFIRAIVAEDMKTGKFGGRVHTRWPPEPNGYLHLGHATAINLNFGIASDFNGLCNFRFDDTNPTAEEIEYVESQKEDTRWLGFDWEDREFYASDYFEQLYLYAEQLVLDGKAYVDSLTADEIREYRGTLTEPGRDSPYRDRQVDENLNLLRRMRAGEFADGEHVLRAKIDMASPNMNMRDPTMYRIRNVPHHQTGDEWHIYPMYDYAHPISDSIERITHSLCSMEYEDHRPLYDWFLDALDIYHPQQIEFARFNISHTVLSKRRLIRLVQEGHVDGWDDPRMPTLAGLRRRGYTPDAIRAFCDEVGINRTAALTEMGAARAQPPLRPQPPRPATHGRTEPAEGCDRKLPGNRDRPPRRSQQPRRPRRRHPSRALLPRDIHREGRLHGRPAAQVLPSRPRTRGTSQVRVLHQVRGSRQGRFGSNRRASLHIRPRNARRLRSRRQAREGDPPLGLRRSRH